MIKSIFPELPEVPVCYTRDLGGGKAWCNTHNIISEQEVSEHEQCHVAEELRQERNRIKREIKGRKKQN